MTRAKWLLLRIDLSLREVLRAFLKSRFTMEGGRGFEPISRSDDLLHCKFIERTVTAERVSDPFGEVTEIEMIRYATTVFRLHRREAEEGIYLLEVDSPSRSLRPLIDAMIPLLGRISVTEVRWPLMNLYKRVKAQSPRARIVKVKACGIPVPEASAMKVEVTSTSDALADFRRQFPGAVQHIERVRIERPFIESPGQLEVTANGLCLFDEAADDEVRALILELTDSTVP